MKSLFDWREKSCHCFWFRCWNNDYLIVSLRSHLKNLNPDHRQDAHLDVINQFKQPGQGVMKPSPEPVPSHQYQQIRGQTLEMRLLMCALRHVRADWQAVPPAACADLCLPCMEDPVSFQDKLIPLKPCYHFPSQVLEVRRLLPN